MDICERSQLVLSKGYITSPHYPDVYPAGADCICKLVADRESSRIHITIYDLLLETRDGRCRADWIMLRQNGQFYNILNISEFALPKT